MRSIFGKGLTVAPLLLAVALAGCAAEPGKPTQAAKAKPSDFSEWPCMSYTLACGKIPTRKPVTQALVGPLNGDPVRGQALANERSKGNCVACHLLKGAEQPGSKGPDLTAYGTWGRSDAEIYALVYDMRSRNPDTVMPPAGANQILTDQELRDVIAFLQSSK
ncbi:MAG: sulfur oxidation c-type cytochrome SoxX [Thiobacillus sp.]|jgi:sulfur-oxidizing protein SoxX|uniref:sulfur oxidation c-type cytochrome SoxX n=1 Tax=Thiobacillus sp. TaxID=924 RepID=UPI0028940D39|nr:sulfur oxidation c-type cytochrome SoxX [Thiobacillus sp.]MDT3705309.1 sulfur oxidation c-type cytochrome SoxX [Thiobacillus sp.]